MINNGIREVILFAGVGVWNTLFDFAVFWLVWRTGEKSPWKHYQNWPVVGHIMGFLCANIVSYFLNKNFTFASSQKDSSFTLYAVVSVVSLCISTAVVFFITKKFTHILSKNMHIPEKQIPIIAKLTGTVFSMVINFVGYKYLVF